MQCLCPGESRPQVGFTGYVGQALVGVDRMTLAVETEDGRTSSGGVDEPEQQPDGGRLARSIGPQVPEHLAGCGLEVEVGQHINPAVGLGQSLRVDCRWHGEVLLVPNAAGARARAGIFDSDLLLAPRGSTRP